MFFYYLLIDIVYWHMKTASDFWDVICSFLSTNTIYIFENMLFLKRINDCASDKLTSRL